MKLTCFSCYATTRGGCNHNLLAWPNARLEDCPKGEYEPGSDESENRGSVEDRLAGMREDLGKTQV